MIDIVDGIGRDIPCVWCKRPLTLSSEFNYARCVNCGGIQYERPKEPGWIKALINKLTK